MRISDWISDVCSSYLPPPGLHRRVLQRGRLERGRASVPGSDQGLTVGLRERRAPPSEKARQRRAFSFVVAVATVIAVALPLPRIPGLPRPGAPPRCA